MKMTSVKPRCQCVSHSTDKTKADAGAKRDTAKRSAVSKSDCTLVPKFPGIEPLIETVMYIIYSNIHSIMHSYKYLLPVSPQSSATDTSRI